MSINAYQPIIGECYLFLAEILLIFEVWLGLRQFVGSERDDIRLTQSPKNFENNFHS